VAPLGPGVGLSVGFRLIVVFLGLEEECSFFKWFGLFVDVQGNFFKLFGLFVGVLSWIPDLFLYS